LICQLQLCDQVTYLSGVEFNVVGTRDTYENQICLQE
jgi:hypothetical protein